MTPDGELVSAYAREGSESAFRALVSRHAGLVYATALRQVGDSGIAEEVAQNVFVALARKAPRLAGLETLAGWLYRTTILEAKARIRAELRRKRRHETAAEIASIEERGATALDALAPLLDEGLLHLRENDRLALMLRFWEDRSLREVGRVLGVNEDAARKRVERALGRLAEFFRRRGLAASGGAAVLMAGVANAAPAGLAASAGNAGLAAGGVSGFNLFIFQVMSMTKTQTAVVCSILAVAPLAWQWRAEASVARQQVEVSALTIAARQNADSLEQELHEARDALASVGNETANLQGQVAALNARREGRGVRTYQWDDRSPFIRVPKQFLRLVPVSAVADRRGRLSDQIKEVLQFTSAEESQVQQALDEFVASYTAAQSQKMRALQPTAADLQGKKPDEVRVFELEPIGEQLPVLRKKLFDTTAAVLGAERFPAFKKSLQEWMPVDDEDHGLNSAVGIFNFGSRQSFSRPAPGQSWIDWSFTTTTGFPGSMHLSVPLDEIPGPCRPYLEDWIALARSKPPAAQEDP
jgi:RNA polymerase sigma factor (sigma-70 family)